MEYLIMIAVSLMAGILIGGISVGYYILKDIKDNNQYIEELKRLCEKYKPFYDIYNGSGKDRYSADDLPYLQMLLSSKDIKDIN